MVTEEFDVETLRGLIAEGYTGQELFTKFATIYESAHADITVVDSIGRKSEFDVEILRDLIAEGYTGQELLDKFIEIRDKVPAAFTRMVQDLIDQSKAD